ncbi:hypothetical protein PHLGIDRAFT_19231 [Phlebiopsis gigantea 11061_1 CR5-6]|uniref:Pectate lyase n=1 Tax=Phlebiopsis gigantea (strain 11061_1 CR5-6) TaxID=745531 RepID=A0A0C3S8A4_PHLG1|nr:hypothetical protein PHLGIDRAFT_19231 [Phlebiopsis gigantea 11061_1 CR5-6]
MLCSIACTVLAASYSIVNAVPLGEMESNLQLGKRTQLEGDKTLIVRDPNVAIWGSCAHVVISNVTADCGTTNRATVSAT